MVHLTHHFMHTQSCQQFLMRSHHPPLMKSVPLKSRTTMAAASLSPQWWSPRVCRTRVSPGSPTTHTHWYNSGKNVGSVFRASPRPHNLLIVVDLIFVLSPQLSRKGQSLLSGPAGTATSQLPAGGRKTSGELLLFVCTCTVCHEQYIQNLLLSFVWLLILGLSTNGENDIQRSVSKR